MSAEQEGRLDNLFDLSGRTALITGAGQGVGRGIALTLSAYGAKVVVNDFYLDRAEAVAEEIKQQDGQAIGVSGDVSDFKGVMGMFEECAAKFAPIDILVNNAGNAGAKMDLAEFSPFWETDPEEWANWLGSNFYGVMNCVRAAMPSMIERKWGRLITITSDAGRVGEPHLATYSAAKAGAAGLMRAMAKAGGRYNITSNCIALGGVATPGAQQMLPDDEAIKRMLKHYVIRRVGRPSDAAAMSLLLASEAGSWITGQTYPVNGGYSSAF